MVVTSKDKKVAVELSWIGEGVDGDYNPDDKDDVPLLRFDVMKRVRGKLEQLDDASYCTQIPKDTPADEQQRLAMLILSEVESRVMLSYSIKKVCEKLSWINVTWGTKNEKQGWVLG